MPPPLQIAYATSEIAPFAKTGGLADVGAALPAELHRMGHDVRPFLPLYGSIDRRARGLEPVGFAQNVPVPMGGRTYTFSLWTAPLADGGPAAYFVDCPELYDRPHIYTADPDEPQRFGLLCRAVLESCQRMGWSPAVLHCHDWHTAILPLLLRTVYAWDALFRRTRTLLTIHNIGYQGIGPARWIRELGLAEWTHLFDPEDLRSERVNLLRTGLVYADLVTTVSPTHAREIQTPEFGHGLDRLLRARASTLVGILNGVDYAVWSPERDTHIHQRYSAQRLEGKVANKRHLLAEMGLAAGNGAPVAGIVSRFVPQKGLDLCFPVLPELLSTTDLRIVAVGSGDAACETFFTWLERQFPGRAVYYRGYSEPLAHVVEAGADLFLMPSRYEPCGLNQMFSQRYGTLPVVRRTGGLADTVEAYDPASARGTGFVFDHATPDGLRWALGLALDTYRDRRRWIALMRRAMARDFSWSTRAAQYAEAYAWLAAR
jgi:starch synthase